VDAVWQPGHRHAPQFRQAGSYGLASSERSLSQGISMVGGYDVARTGQLARRSAAGNRAFLAPAL
jgi:hypothetical protein